MADQATMTTRNVRLADIALEAGVSRVTVSKVLSRSTANNTRVAKPTAQRIRSIAKRLGYTPNLAAKQLAGGKSGLIGVIVDSFAPEVEYKVLAHLEREAARQGYQLIVGQLHDDVPSIGRYFEEFVGRDVEAVVCLSHDYPQSEATLKRLSTLVPNTIFVGRPKVLTSRWVAVDTPGGIEMLVEHLVAGGRTKIGLFLVSDIPITCHERKVGFLRAIGKFGLDPSRCPVWVMKQNPFESDRGDVNTRIIQHNARELFDRHSLDAVVANNDLVAMYVIQHLAQRGLRVPRDVAVTGWDNSTMADAALPPITSVDLCSGQVAGHVMRLLMDSHENQAVQPVIVQPQIVVRQSTLTQDNERSCV